MVEDAVLMGDCIVHEGANVTFAIVDRDVSIGKGAVVGEKRSESKGIAVIGEGVAIGENATVKGGEIVSDKGGCV